MESKFRPIPVTILDFLAVLLPGFVWLILLTITAQFLLDGHSLLIESPIAVLDELTSKKDPESSALPIVIFVLVASLIIGYAMKPIAMRLAEIFTIFLFKRQKKYRHLPLKDLKYPFTELYKATDYYTQVCIFLTEHLHCSLEELKGHLPFSAAKRYLRLVAPALWEECERMEAEVRMTGVLFLAAFYSSALSGVMLIGKLVGVFRYPYFSSFLVWFVLSALMSIILAEGFNRQRYREVGYTYINALIASKFKPIVASKESETEE